MSTISASTTSTTAYKVTADTTGTLVLQTGASPTTAVTIDTSQNVGIGTSSPLAARKLTVQGRVAVSNTSGSNDSQLAFYADGTTNGIYSTYNSTGSYLPMAFYTSDVERMRIDSSGNVGINASSPTSVLDARGAAALDNQSYGQLTVASTAAYNASPVAGIRFGVKYNAAGAYVYGTSVYGVKENATDGNYGQALVFSTQAYTQSPLERMRIDSSGNLLVGTTSAVLSNGIGIKLLPGNSGQFGIVSNESTNNSHYHHYNTNATYNGYRFYTLTNGGVVNYSGNNQNLSDERSKKNIEVSGGYLDKICAIPVKLFNYKDEQDGEQRTLGVIAQDVEVVAPELVNFDGFGDTPEDGVPLKSIYTTDMMFALMKAIQEQQAIIETLTNRIQALENK